MTRSFLFATVCSTFAVLVVTTDSLASTLTNAGFEEGSVGLALSIPGWTGIDTPDVASPGGLALGTPDIVLAKDLVASPDGGQFALLRNEPILGVTEGVSQEVTGLVLGATYVVSFYVANGGIQDLRSSPDQVGEGHVVTAIGSASFTSPTLSFEGFGSQTWQQLSYSFVAENETDTISIIAEGYVGGGAQNIGRLAMDGVSITLVPEPQSIALIIAGLFGLGIRQRPQAARAVGRD